MNNSIYASRGALGKNHIIMKGKRLWRTLGGAKLGVEREKRLAHLKYYAFVCLLVDWVFLDHLDVLGSVILLAWVECLGF